ncbi:hypothetical protein FNF31_02704 [Cafeteria roenbergensis]|uniref:Uncharacterized protein n=1 Tax=Cafeteria roenbergensis TaxID=33653 RepID=A0A5A8DFQ8_CAFRO|nr:hypothetical protein FNF28_07152 [Cafeteria roenbergensis]KAA0163849.1 hypothetical protein FNF31_02704 [Cafeteria roenbergensis]
MVCVLCMVPLLVIALKAFFDWVMEFAGVKRASKFYPEDHPSEEEEAVEDSPEAAKEAASAPSPADDASIRKRVPHAPPTATAAA